MGKTYRNNRSYEYEDDYYNSNYKSNKNKSRKIKEFLRNKKTDKTSRIDETRFGEDYDGDEWEDYDRRK